MKNLLKQIKFFLLAIILASCSTDDSNKEETFLYKSEKLNFTELINRQTGNVSKTLNEEDDFIHSEFETSFYIPDNLMDSELENYIFENQSSINGTFKYLMNDEEFITIEIENGQEVNSTYANRNLLAGPYPCTYDGIQDCVQDIVYNEWTTLDALMCAYSGGLGCIAQEAANCVLANC